MSDQQQQENKDNNKQVKEEKQSAAPIITSNDSKQLIAVSTNKQVQVFSLTTGDETWSFDAQSTVLAIQFSFDGQHLAVSSDNKLVSIFTLNDDGQSFKEIGRASSKKKVSCMTFSQANDELLFGDKFGDVHSVKLSQFDTTAPDVQLIKDPELRLGHVSWLTDIKLSLDGKYLITADRDEKIRVNYYPGAYEIHQFLLGHSELVAWIHPLKDNLLLSASADSTLKLWSIENGECLSTLQIPDLISNACCSSSDDSVWVSYENKQIVEQIRIRNGALVKENTISLESNVYSLTLAQGTVVALVGDAPHLRSVDGNTAVPLEKISQKISLDTVAAESSGKSTIRKAKKARLE